MSGAVSKRALKIRAVIRVTILLCVLMITVLETVGFPGWVTDVITKRMSCGSFVVLARGMRLDLLSGLYIKDVEIYRKKRIGPPAVDCKVMRLRFNPFSGLMDGASKYSVEFRNGEIIPSQATADESGGSGEICGLNVMFSRMTIHDVMFERMSTVVSSRGDSVSATNIVCLLGGEHGLGTATGWVDINGASRSASGHIITAFDPHKIRPFLESISWNYPSKLIDRFVWNSNAPLVDTTFEVAGVDGYPSVSSKSLFSMVDYTYRGVSNDTCDGLVTVEYDSTTRVVNVDNITIGIDDGVIVGGFTFDDKSDLVSYRAASDVDPKDFFQMVGLFDGEAMKSWRFEGQTRFISEGVVGFGGWDRTALKAEVDASKIGIGSLIADECRFNVIMNGSTCRLTNISGSICDGQFNARAQIGFGGEAKGRVDFGCELKACDFSKVASTMGASVSNKVSGKFNLDMAGSFLLSSNVLESVTAKGQMSVVDGRVFQLPVFGGLTRIMTKIIPGLDFVLRQSNMKSLFEVANGRVSSEKISIDGGVLSLTARGAATFDGQLDYAVQLTLMKEHTVVAKVLRAVTWPISKLMEFRLKGPVSAPEWYPVNFSMDLLERMGLKSSDKKPETKGNN